MVERCARSFVDTFSIVLLLDRYVYIVFPSVFTMSASSTHATCVLVVDTGVLTDFASAFVDTFQTAIGPTDPKLTARSYMIGYGVQ